MVNAVAKYQKYAEYKDSGIDWLGSIPANWRLNKLRYLFDFNKGLTITKENLEDEGIPCVSYGEVHSKFGFEVDPLKHDLKCVNESYLKTSDNALLSKGDFVFADTSEDLKGSGNFTHLVNNELVFAGYHTIIAKPKDATSSRFYAYLFDSKEFRSQIQLAVKGVKVFSITQAILRASDIWLPSKSEQTQIANFLDHETAKIDSLIEKQQKLIELLKEKRQAVISHAVTKGLNPDVPMKDSGNIWARQIPTHWKLTKLTYIAKVGNGATPARDNEKYWKDGTVGWLNSSKVNDVIITQADQFITPLAKSQTSVQVVQPNDLVMAITGEGQTRGRVAICQLDATINQHLASIRIVDKNLYHEFLFYWLTANYERIRYESTGAGSTKGAITCGDIGLFPVPVPSYAEQLEIVSQIKKQSLMFKQLMEKAESAIQLMQERRTVLISSAVTGKIDVRYWQNPNHKNEAQMELSQ